MRNRYPSYLNEALITHLVVKTDHISSYSKIISFPGNDKLSLKCSNLTRLSRIIKSQLYLKRSHKITSKIIKNEIKQ